MGGMEFATGVEPTDRMKRAAGPVVENKERASEAA